MVQDSYAAGHTDRNPLTDAVTQFHTYGSQDHGLHGAKDQWGDGKTLADRLQSTHGAQAAVDSSARILTMLDQGAPTDKVIEYLDQQVFRLDPAVKPAGPGDQFQANPPKTQKA